MPPLDVSARDVPAVTASEAPAWPEPLLAPFCGGVATGRACGICEVVGGFARAARFAANSRDRDEAFANGKTPDGAACPSLCCVRIELELVKGEMLRYGSGLRRNNQSPMARRSKKPNTPPTTLPMMTLRFEL